MTATGIAVVKLTASPGQTFGLPASPLPPSLDAPPFDADVLEAPPVALLVEVDALPPVDVVDALVEVAGLPPGPATSWYPASAPRI